MKLNRIGIMAALFAHGALGSEPSTHEPKSLSKIRERKQKEEEARRERFLAEKRAKRS